MDNVITHTEIPEFLLPKRSKSWEIAQRLAQLVGGVDPERQIAGNFWSTSNWQEGCKLCAVGAAMEQLETDRDKLREIKRSDATFAGKLHGLYVNRFGPVSYEDFRYAYLMIMRLNDNGRLTFPQISQAVQEAYDEFTSTRIGAGTDRNGAG